MAEQRVEYSLQPTNIALADARQPVTLATTPAPLPEYVFVSGAYKGEQELNTLAAKGYELVATSKVTVEVGVEDVLFVLRLSPQARQDAAPMVQQLWQASVSQRYRIDALEAVQAARGEVLTALEERVEQLERELRNLAADVPVVE